MSLEMMRMDLQESLEQSSIDPRNLSSFQRVLLTTDGTVTEILEAFLWEAMIVVKISQDQIVLEKEVPYLEIKPATEVILRKILLRGKCSHKNYIHAESIIIPDRLGKELKEGLEKTKKPLGQLMLETRLETFREILSCRMENAGELAKYFNIQSTDPMIARTYRVFVNRKPAILITEKFPEESFKDQG